MRARSLVVLDGHTLNPGDLSWSRLEQIAECAIYDRTPADEIVARARDAELLLTNKTPVRQSTIEQCPRLKYIGVLATGYDVVDVAAARERQFVVTNVPTYGTASVAQLVFALLLELCHHVKDHSDSVHKGDWSRSKEYLLRAPPPDVEAQAYLAAHPELWGQAAMLATVRDCNQAAADHHRDNRRCRTRQSS